MSLSSEAGAIAPASKSGYKHRDGSPKGNQVRIIYHNIHIKIIYILTITQYGNTSVQKVK